MVTRATMVIVESIYSYKAITQQDLGYTKENLIYRSKNIPIIYQIIDTILIIYSKISIKHLTKLYR